MVGGKGRDELIGSEMLGTSVMAHDRPSIGKET